MHRTATVRRRWRSGRVLVAFTSVFATFLASALAAQQVDVQALEQAAESVDQNTLYAIASNSKAWRNSAEA